MLNQSTHVSVANSTASRLRQGPSRRLLVRIKPPLLVEQERVHSEQREPHALTERPREGRERHAYDKTRPDPQPPHFTQTPSPPVSGRAF